MHTRTLVILRLRSLNLALLTPLGNPSSQASRPRCTPISHLTCQLDQLIQPGPDTLSLSPQPNVDPFLITLFPGRVDELRIHSAYQVPN